MPSDTWWNLDPRKREDILTAAVAEFAVHHYEDASLSALVKHVGIAKGSMYQYFTDKRELYDYLLHYAHETLQRAIVAEMPHHLTPQSDMFAILRAYLYAIGAVTHAYPLLTQLVNRSLHDTHAGAHNAHQLYERYIITFAHELVESAVQDRSLRHDVRPEGVVFLLLQVIRGVMQQPARAQDTALLDELVVLLDQGLRYRMRQ
ncbi:MAG: TetR/AcrR family transcriptional regulator [Roseiflexaceae bacterium]|jgi:AcrR family transcriptional regulator|nr:TetR/AcrR family transcriptional regulator [Chloroflexaceae bacterium]